MGVLISKMFNRLPKSRVLMLAWTVPEKPPCCIS